MPKKADAVFEGGGVKGIGLVGAVVATEEQGYQFENVAGTSAGAIVAALVAAGYSGKELQHILERVDYKAFCDEGKLDKIPLVGKALSLGFEKGIYEGAFFETWLRQLLADKGKRTFRDMVMPEYADNPRYRYKLRVIASDISRERLLVLPQDIADYGIKPDDLDIAHAVRMSMSIPFFFEPVKLTRTPTNEVSYIVDGGILSNFPVFLFDSPNIPEWPTFGYRLVSKKTEPGHGVHHEVRGPITLFTSMFRTMLDAHDARYIQDSDFVRTIAVPTLGVASIDFDLSPDRASGLYGSGYGSAKEFFKTWDFEKYRERYRISIPLSRRERLM